MSTITDVIAIVVTGLMVGNEVAVAAFIHPALAALDQRSHAAAAARIAAVLGRYMPFWYGLGLLVLLVELFTHRTLDGRLDLRLLAAALIWAATIVFTVVMLVPINNRVARADPAALYPTWQTDRARWDALHRIRILGLVVAFVLLLVVVLPAR